MVSHEPRRWGQVLLGWCLGFLAGAIALRLAVELVAAVWWQLSIAAVLAVTIAGVVWWRRRW